MRFLVDAQLPPALVGVLRLHGHEAEHVVDVGAADMTDSEIWAYALRHGAVIVTKDGDFAAMAATGREAPAIVWVRTGNTRRAALLAWLDPLVDTIVGLVDTGHGVIELR